MTTSPGSDSRPTAEADDAGSLRDMVLELLDHDVAADVRLDHDVAADVRPDAPSVVSVESYRAALYGVLGIEEIPDLAVAGFADRRAYRSGYQHALRAMVRVLATALADPGSASADRSSESGGTPPGRLLALSPLLWVFDGDGQAVASFAMVRLDAALVWATVRAVEPGTALPVAVVDLAYGRIWTFSDSDPGYIALRGSGPYPAIRQRRLALADSGS